MVMHKAIHQGVPMKMARRKEPYMRFIVPEHKNDPGSNIFVDS